MDAYMWVYIYIYFFKKKQKPITLGLWIYFLTPNSGLTGSNNTIYIYISSSSSWRAASTDFPDPLLPLVPIVHCSRQVFSATSCISTKLLYIGSSWFLYPCSSMRGGPQEYIVYDLSLTSPAVSCISCSYNFAGFRGKVLVFEQLLLWGILPPGLVPYSSQHSCAIAVKLSLHTLSQHPCGASIDTTAAWKKQRFILYDRFIDSCLCLRYVNSVVCVRNRSCGVSFASGHFLSLNLPTFKVRSLGR